MRFKGKRGKVYSVLGFAIKVRNRQSLAINRIRNEVNWLKKLNKYDIGPVLFYGNDNFLITSFVRGEFILDYWKHCSYEDKLFLVKEVFRQCRILDRLKVNKFEMHRPVKHIIIKNKRAVMIDFERCRFSKKPKNVTGFAQFLIRNGFGTNKEKLRKLLVIYKKDFSEEGYNKIVRSFS